MSSQLIFVLLNIKYGKRRANACNGREEDILANKLGADGLKIAENIGPKEPIQPAPVDSGLEGEMENFYRKGGIREDVIW